MKNCFVEQVDEAYPSSGKVLGNTGFKLVWVRNLNVCGVHSNKSAN